jgi:hypothetical protein
MYPQKFYEFLKLGNVDYLKVYLVLFYKGMSWEKELELEFSISTKIVKRALEILELEGFIISKDFWSLEIDDQETINKLNGGYFQKVKTYPKFYSLTEEGRELFNYTYLEEIQDLILRDNSLKISINFIFKKAKAYLQVKEDNKNKEKNKFYRKRIDSQTGIVYISKTSDFKKKELEIKKAVYEEIQKNMNNNSIIKGNNVIDNVSNSNSSLSVNVHNKNQKYDLYNGKKASFSQFEENVERLRNEDKIIEKAKLSKGKVNFNLSRKNKSFGKKSISEILSFEDKHDRELEEKLYSALNIYDSEKYCTIIENYRNLFDNLVIEIRKARKVSYFKVESVCKSSEVFNSFLEFIRDKKIHLDEDCDFFVCG